MPERKNQHYVPRHVLKAWTNDDRISFLHFESEKIHEEHPAKVCSRSYLYGSPVVEGEIGEIERLQSRPIDKLRGGATLTSLSLQERQLLLSFATTQRNRIRSTQLDIQESGEESIKEGVQDDIGTEKFEYINWKGDLTDEEKVESLVDASILGIHHRLIIHGIFGYMSIGDLQGVMLRNCTSREFVISDSPIVHDNPRFKPERHMVKAGLGNRGLQIFCPIGPNRLLLLYDPQIYSFNPDSGRQFLIKSRDVVDDINLLQFHNADDIIMSHALSDKYLLDLLDRIDEVRRREKIITNQETPSGGPITIENIPRDQIPKRSPNISGCRVNAHLDYEVQRNPKRIDTQRSLINMIFRETNGLSDVSVIYSIRFLQELTDLQ